MSENQSPWAKPGSVDAPAAVVFPPAQSVGERATRGSEPLIDLSAHPGGPARPDDDPVLESGRVPLAGPGWTRSGAITRTGTAPGLDEPDVIQFGKPRDPRAYQRRMLLWFGGTAGTILVIGVIVLIALALTGNSPLRHPPSGPSDYRPPLAKACPPPSDPAGNNGAVPPAPPGPRTVDTSSGISYAAQGAPWEPWDEVWEAGDLHVKYGVGQHFVTEVYPAGTYHASILSGSVPAAENDALTLDLKCTGHQVLADVRASYYPQPNTIDMMRDEVTTLGGRPAWVTKFRLHFHADGLKATSELVGLALIDVGRPNAAVLYVSIPNTVDQFDPLVDSVMSSVRPT